ncbi:phosphoenolpyruvate synthase [Microbacterium sp. BK668]|uniref:phosphoenolpyruvate synthase n=1 Tax=Microbacterium sp. BK668 TaxID=2512118 RepID=UPI0010D9AE84|nr:phosphoenolpyruvate synthase [Microbacterium sp. BK668]TDN91606.1 phosphoenolpyruvate synthase [Microbacterium sp. BK668]
MNAYSGRGSHGDGPMDSILWFRDISMADLPRVGGKNASLGEMIGSLSRAGVRVPEGYATTAAAFRAFLRHDDLDRRIEEAISRLDPEDVDALAETAASIRQWVLSQPFPSDLERDIRSAHDTLVAVQDHPADVTWAVRSSATAEDLPDASFAGQQETYLHIAGAENVLDAVRSVFASLYTDRAIVYRAQHGFAGESVAISAGVQRMVRSDVGSSGVMFTVDTESGFDDVVLVTSAYGLGETVVQGAVNPDEYCVYKPALRAGRPAILKREVGTKAIAMRFAAGTGVGTSTETVDVPAADRVVFSISDTDVEELARAALTIEEHYGRPMDIEWARDGLDGKLYIVQARPETTVANHDRKRLQRYTLTAPGEVLARGRAVGTKIGAGRARVMHDLGEMHLFHEGDVLVADRTDPDWEPIMRRAAAIVTNRGGRTCHAAIVARELGIPAVVGTLDATRTLDDGDGVTVSCAAGDDGLVYRGRLDYSVEETAVDDLPALPVEVMLNVAVPDQAFSLAALPNSGVGLARLEFIVSTMIGIHPQALARVDEVPEPLRGEVLARTAAYASPRQFFVQRVAEGMSSIAAAFAPKPVIVRLSDFKTNEYAGLLGGELFEPTEENPMLGWRGASRYATERFADCFAMECEALRYVRDVMGLTNLQVMVPFVRTPQEAEEALAAMARNGLSRGVNGLEVMMMCEIPSNALRADEFLELFDGFSIGSNDLTQLTLGVDRDSELVAPAFDERDPAVLDLLDLAIAACNRHGKYVGICGQGPSDHPDFAAWLMERGIRSMSLNPDAVISTWLRLGERAAIAAG